MRLLHFQGLGVYQKLLPFVQRYNGFPRKLTQGRWVGGWVGRSFAKMRLFGSEFYWVVYVLPRAYWSGGRPPGQASEPSARVRIIFIYDQDN